MDTGRMAFRSQTRRARGDLGLPFFISCGRSKMGKAKHRIIPTKVRYTDGLFTTPTKSARALRLKNKTSEVRKPKALRGMR